MLPEAPQCWEGSGLQPSLDAVLVWWRWLPSWLTCWPPWYLPHPRPCKGQHPLLVHWWLLLLAWAGFSKQGTSDRTPAWSWCYSLACPCVLLVTSQGHLQHWKLFQLLVSVPSFLTYFKDFKSPVITAALTSGIFLTSSTRAIRASPIGSVRAFNLEGLFKVITAIWNPLLNIVFLTNHQPVHCSPDGFSQGLSIFYCVALVEVPWVSFYPLSQPSCLMFWFCSVLWNYFDMFCTTVQ